MPGANRTSLLGRRNNPDELRWRPPISAALRERRTGLRQMTGDWRAARCVCAPAVCQVPRYANDKISTIRSPKAVAADILSGHGDRQFLAGKNQIGARPGLALGERTAQRAGAICQSCRRKRLRRAADGRSLLRYSRTRSCTASRTSRGNDATAASKRAANFSAAGALAGPAPS